MTRIDTVDSLNALPIGSVIGVERRGEFTLYTQDVDGWWSANPNTYRLDVDHLPATLLHVPGRDLVQEAQADAWDEGFRAGLVDNPYRNEAP